MRALRGIGLIKRAANHGRSDATRQDRSTFRFQDAHTPPGHFQASDAAATGDNEVPDRGHQAAADSSLRASRRGPGITSGRHHDGQPGARSYLSLGIHHHDDHHGPPSSRPPSSAPPSSRPPSDGAPLVPAEALDSGVGYFDDVIADDEF